MHSSLVNKIEKAHRYAREPERIELGQISATFHGGHDDYRVTMDGGRWSCTCHTYSSHAIGETCSHIMAMQQVLGSMLAPTARYWSPEPTYATTGD